MARLAWPQHDPWPPPPDEDFEILVFIGVILMVLLALAGLR